MTGLRSAPWLSGFFIVATDAWMQHPVGYRLVADGTHRARRASAAVLLSALCVAGSIAHVL